MKPIQLTLLTLLCIPAVLFFAPRGNSKEQLDGTAPGAELVARGKYLVDFGGCNDCHTPLKLTDNGPEPDLTRFLSGHPQDVKLPPPDLKPGPWFAATAGMTAWAGPWGISYSPNLTPDKKTGLGAWTEDMFIKAMRTGRHMGYGRPILPPMPWRGIGGLTDEDLKAVFAYLRTIPAIENQVPLPVGPDGEVVSYE
ncbi:MAG TPA: cytochrome c [Verrucomicrobia bacterium]|nr:cytochrome c [Verrucomicrobiota bacterium]HOP97392.1 c-type cytochrome [Verrucomicrobiota bacterium]HPU55971.1 c-type cytochrome [Verrucomicrobiota bacterium]